MDNKLECLAKDEDIVLYRMQTEGKVCTLIASTPETRSICNDPTVAGIAYTSRLRMACAKVLKAGGAFLPLVEDEIVVINILRGGLNFGLRDALHEAYGWNNHTTCFISAQRARNTSNPEEWHITENAYRKVYFPRKTSLVIGDVVATGTSLSYALDELLRTALEAGTRLKSILFFTFGGPKALEILEKVDAECRLRFPGYQQTTLVYLEGCFEVPDLSSPLSIRLTGTDLVRYKAIMAPEFVTSQYANPAYPIERCIIYDAGSRAFWVREFAADVYDYWKQVLDLADRGVTFEQYLKERFPEIEADKFGQMSLKDVALGQLAKMKPFIP